MEQPYTRIPNWFFDILPDLDGPETKMMNAVIRATSGWHRDEVQLTNRELQDLTGIKSRTTIIRTAASLATKGYLIIRAEGQDRYYRTPTTLQGVQKMNTPPVHILDTPSSKNEHPPVQTLDTFGAKPVQKMNTFERPLKKKDLKKTVKKEEEENPPPHPAIGIYQEIFQRLPDQHEREFLTRTLTDFNPDRWREVCKLWAAKGWQPHILTGLVDRYQRNAPARASPSRSGSPTAPPPTTGTIELDPIEF